MRAANGNKEQEARSAKRAMSYELGCMGLGNAAHYASQAAAIPTEWETACNV
ncbi:hypothetical protein IG631_21791 [Alternaria alternata]|nr:hypothetical protein IG631_21791 [Alternaria alternata]